MEFSEILKELQELGKKNGGFVFAKDVIQYYPEDSENYDKIEKELAKEEIDIMPDEDDSNDDNAEPNLSEAGNWS